MESQLSLPRLEPHLVMTPTVLSSGGSAVYEGSVITILIAGGLEGLSRSSLALTNEHGMWTTHR